jgi:hypothetical protein
MKEDLLAGRRHAVLNVDNQHLSGYVKDRTDSTLPIWNPYFYHIRFTSNRVPNSRQLPKKLFKLVLYELSKE